MREHKFRAWDKKLRRMFPVHSLYADAVGIRKDGHIWLYERKQFVVMQSTGLRDRHAQDIYEGDIVHQRFYTLDWDKLHFGYHVGAVRILPSMGVCISKPSTYVYTADQGDVDERVLMTAPLEEVLEQYRDDLNAWERPSFPVCVEDYISGEPKKSVVTHARYIKLRGSRSEVLGDIYEHPELLEVAQ